MLLLALGDLASVVPKLKAVRAIETGEPFDGLRLALAAIFFDSDDVAFSVQEIGPVELQDGCPPPSTAAWM
jgi:hypothetical protein